MINFMLGALTALTITLVTTTTPDQALENWKQWRSLVMKAFG